MRHGQLRGNGIGKRLRHKPVGTSTVLDCHGMCARHMPRKGLMHLLGRLAVFPAPWEHNAHQAANTLLYRYKPCLHALPPWPACLGFWYKVPLRSLYICAHVAYVLPSLL